jgi:hypothetical protein
VRVIGPIAIGRDVVAAKSEEPEEEPDHEQHDRAENDPRPLQRHASERYGGSDEEQRHFQQQQRILAAWFTIGSKHQTSFEVGSSSGAGMASA